MHTVQRSADTEVLFASAGKQVIRGVKTYSSMYILKVHLCLVKSKITWPVVHCAICAEIPHIWII